MDAVTAAQGAGDLDEQDGCPDLEYRPLAALYSWVVSDMDGSSGRGGWSTSRTLESAVGLSAVSGARGQGGARLPGGDGQCLSEDACPITGGTGA